MKILITAYKPALYRIKILTLSNIEIHFRIKRCFSSPRRIIELDLNEKVFIDSRPLRYQINLLYWIIKEIINHPKFFLKKFISTYKIELDNPGDIDLPIKVALHGKEGSLWISRNAVEKGIWPSEIDAKLEYDLIRNPNQFEVFVHDLANTEINFKHFEKIPGNYSKNQSVTGIKFDTHLNVIVHHGKVVISNNSCLVNVDDISRNCSKKVDLFNLTKMDLGVLKSYSNLGCVDSAIFIGSSLSWYHFIAECATKLTKLPSDLLRGTPIILEKNVPDSIGEMVKMITGVEPIKVGNYENLKVRKLHIVSGLITTEDLFDSGILKTLRLLILNQFPNQKTESNKKIFIRRPSNLFRPLQNEKSLIRFLQKKEFEINEPSTMSFIEQIKLMQSADIIVAESGAALTNVMFVGNETKLIELHPAVDASDFWKGYSLNFIQDYEKISGKTRWLGRKGLARDGFAIELKVLDKILNRYVEKA